MTKLRFWALALLGLALPVAVAFSAYLLSSSSLGEAKPLPFPTAQVASGNPQFVVPDGEGKGEGEDKPSATPTGSGEDVSGKCDEAEHENDPECTGDSSSGSSGSGGSSTSPTRDDRGGSDSSGSGSSGSSGSGSSDSSGSGSGGSGDDSSHSGGSDD